MPTTETSTSAEVRAVMARRGLTVAEVADAAGLSTVQLSRRINGHVAWTVGDLSLVARALDVETTSLLPSAPYDGPDAA